MKKRMMLIALSVLLMIGLLPASVLAATGDYHDDGTWEVQELADGTAALTRYIGADTLTGEVTLPSTVAGYTVTRIADNVLSSKSDVTKFTVPEGVTYLGKYSFTNSSGFTSISLPESLKVIDDAAFYGCRALTEVTLPSALETIGIQSFAYCNSLEKVVMGNHVTSIGNSAFSYSPKINSLNLSTSLTFIDVGAFQECTALHTVTIPASLTTIGQAAFLNSGLTSIDIPSTVTEIGGSAFAQSAALTSVTLHNGLQTIGIGAFAVTGLTEVTIPSTVTSIAGNAFMNCYDLAEVTIKGATTSIGSSAFNCSNLVKATVLIETGSFNEIAFYHAPLTDGIYGFAGTTTEAFANTNSIPFHPLYKVTFDSQGGSAVDCGYEALHSTVDEPDAPSYAGNFFGGWYPTPACDTTQVTFPYTVAGTAALYAKWTPLTLGSSDADGSIAVGAGLTLTPGTTGGTWTFDSAYFSRSGNTFTALKSGTSTITYTVSGVSKSYEVTAAVPVLTLDSSDADGSISINGSLTLTPGIAGGTWTFDSAYFSREGGTFTALKSGSSKITYTASGVSKNYEVTILPELTLGSSDADGSITVGASLTLTPGIAGGTWTFDSAYFSREGGTFTALKAGPRTITYTASGVSKSYAVTASLPELMLDSSDADGKLFVGGRVTLTPGIAGGTWTFDSAYFTREGGTFTALKAGASTITYTASGVSKSYAVTIAANALPQTGQSFAWVWLLAALALALTATGVWMRRRAASQR